MADDMDLRIPDNLNHALCVLLLRTALIPRNVNARNSEIEPPYLLVRQIKTALRIEDIDLAAHQQPNAVHLAGHGEHIFEIQRWTSSWHTRPMLRNAQHLQPHVSGGLRHLLQATVGMPRCHRMRMRVN